MDKNWLIRTKSNHILGPVSKEKVVELYQNGSIKPDDEVCSGNGYWFFIREDDMVERFLTGSEVQGFNPISEAKDILIPGPTKKKDLGESNDVTLVGGLNISELQAPEVAEPPPENKPLPQKTNTTQAEATPVENKKKNHSPITPKTVLTQPEPALKKQNYLQYLGILGFILLFLVVYFRKTIISYLFQGEISHVTFLLINTAHAQEDVPGKKKSF